MKQGLLKGIKGIALPLLFLYNIGFGENYEFRQKQEIKKDFWEFVFSDLDTSRYVVYESETRRLFFKDTVLSFEEEEALDLVNSLCADSLCADSLVKIKKGLKQEIDGAIERSWEYIPMLEEKLKENDLNPEFAKLPVLESLFRHDAVSKAGAGGLYQLMPGTARNYNLIVNKYFDQRMDPVIAADAFVLYLKDLDNLFGKEEFVLTSYNLGENGMLKRIRKAAKELGKGENEVSFEDVYDYLPGFATKNFHVSYQAVCSAYRKHKKKNVIDVKVVRLEDIGELEDLIEIEPMGMKVEDFVIKGFFPNIEEKRYVFDLEGEKKVVEGNDLVITTLNYPTKISDIMRATGMSEEDVIKHNPSYKRKLFRDDAEVPRDYIFRFMMNSSRLEELKEKISGQSRLDWK